MSKKHHAVKAQISRRRQCCLSLPIADPIADHGLKADGIVDGREADSLADGDDDGIVDVLPDKGHDDRSPITVPNAHRRLHC